MVGLNAIRPDRETDDEKQAKKETERMLDAADKLEDELKTPDTFKVKFECTNGTFVCEFYKDWAPQGVGRMYELVKSGALDQARFFRVVPNFIVQFGIPGDPQVAAKWRSANIPDDPVTHGNARGTVTFAMAGPNTRTSQLFINLVDNARLDSMGFAAIGKVIEGMEVVDAINPEYGELPDQGRIQRVGNAYLEKEFPRLDYIKSATLEK